MRHGALPPATGGELVASQRAPKDGSAGRAYGAAKGGLLAPSDIRVRAQFLKGEETLQHATVIDLFAR